MEGFYTMRNKCVIALGFFDGVHLGHAALLRRTVEEAARWAGWSLSRTKSALFRMRKKLKDYLKKEGFYHG